VAQAPPSKTEDKASSSVFIGPLFKIRLKDSARTKNRNTTKLARNTIIPTRKILIIYNLDILTLKAGFD
jgi:hypothetical protein